jgi:hypothetical protein
MAKSMLKKGNIYPFLAEKNFLLFDFGAAALLELDLP